MRRVVGHLSRAVLIAFVLAGIAAVARFYADGTLSPSQFEGAMASAVDRAKSIVRSGIHAPVTVSILVFAGGVALGWVLALWWTAIRWRSRPLIIADLRNADMPIADAVHHVRANAFPHVNDDRSAIRLILVAASRGRVTLWRRASANKLRRVPRRRVDEMLKQLEKMPAIDLARSDSRSGLTILSAQLERLWPAQRSEIGSRKPFRLAPNHLQRDEIASPGRRMESF